MTEIDYDKIGFKSGLEIHQQLDANGKKLFCHCPAVLRNDEPDFVVERKLHAVAGESGEVDVAARHEAEKGKTFVYQCYDTTCLVELDEEPPHEINQEALKIALQISLLLNCRIQTITQIMRKTVVDGSNTGGFQRTVLIAKDGFVESSFGKVGIDSVFLEEDSARHVSRDDEKIAFRLDRLGIPLVEIATKADLKNAEHAKETALKIGAILRACKVRRGIGTIRQDINISVKGSSRVELKGFQEPKIMIKTVENEVNRQLEFVKKKEKNFEEVRNVLADGSSEFLRPMPGSARMYPETDLPLLKISKQIIDEVKKTLPEIVSKEEIESELKRVGLHHEMIKLILKENSVDEFRELLDVLGGKNADLVVKMLLIFPKEIASKEKKSFEEIEDKLNKDVLVEILENLKKGKISERDVKDVMKMIVEGRSLEEALSVEKADVSDVEEKILKIIKSKPGLSANAYMGLVMKEFGGKISGKEAMEIIEKLGK